MLDDLIVVFVTRTSNYFFLASSSRLPRPNGSAVSLINSTGVVLGPSLLAPANDGTSSLH